MSVESGRLSMIQGEVLHIALQLGRFRARAAPTLTKMGRDARAMCPKAPMSQHAPWLQGRSDEGDDGDSAGAPS